MGTHHNLRDTDSGATAVEYGLMIALIAVVIIAAVTLVGQGVINNFGRNDSAIYSALS
jgi:pilus assembly protein Flp/PilA